MRVTVLGHSGLKVETADATVLCDPWLSPAGAFQASWFPFPDNAHVISPTLLTPTAIVFTQSHADHVDPWFLRQVAPDVPAIICASRAGDLRRAVLAAGPRRIIEAAPWERVRVSEETTVFVVPEETPLAQRAAAVVQQDGQSLLDLSGARLAPIQLHQLRAAIRGRIDLLCVEGTSATWFPTSYDYSEEHQRELSRQKRLARFAYMARAVRALEAVHAVPFGAPCFLDPELARHNREMDGGIFPDQKQSAEWLADRGIPNVMVMLPGDVWDTASRRKEAEPLWEGFSFANRERYLELYAERRRTNLESVLTRYVEPTDSLWESFRDYFEHLLTLSPYFNEKIGIRVGFRIDGPGGGAWSVDFRKSTRGVRRTMGECGYQYRFEARWALPLFTRELAWEDFFLSLRFRARTRDVCNDHLMLLKLSDADALRAVEQYRAAMRSDDMIRVHSEGQVYRVQRYCPHAGNDLLDCGEVMPGGILRCRAHQYEFALGTGACLNGDCPALRVEPVAPPPPLTSSAANAIGALP